ncbi:MAG: homocysteine S-methyltransferase family protein, partial [Gammaproteobacteria bacterium]
MKSGDKLGARLAHKDVILLDGAVGTQLQRYGVPMNNTAWAAVALETHPDTVRYMHRRYIECDVDIITTNTYSSARHNLEPLGMGDLTRELNLRAVSLAQDAIARHATRDVFIAGSVSNFGIVTEGEQSASLHRYSRPRSGITAEQARMNLGEQAQILADAGVDLLLAESTGSMTQRRWVLDACLQTGLPTWLGYRARLEQGDPEVRVGYSSAERLEDGLKDLASAGADVVCIFHSTVPAVTASIPVVKRHWSGPIAAYPEADRTDYTATHRDESVDNSITVEEFSQQAAQWVRNGVQVIGGCCG